MGSLPADKITLHRKCCGTFFLSIFAHFNQIITARLILKKKFKKVERIEVGISFGILIHLVQFQKCNKCYTLFYISESDQLFSDRCFV